MADEPKTMGECWEIFKRNGFMLPASPLDPSLFPNAKRILEIEAMLDKMRDKLTGQVEQLEVKAKAQED